MDFGKGTNFRQTENLHEWVTIDDFNVEVAFKRRMGRPEYGVNEKFNGIQKGSEQGLRSHVTTPTSYDGIATNDVTT